MNPNSRPRFIVRRHVKYCRRQRFSYEWNRHGYPLRDIHAVHGPGGHLGHHARTLPGAWLAALSLPVRWTAARWWNRVYQNREWTCR